jgi:hypothetical protein
MYNFRLIKCFRGTGRVNDTFSVQPSISMLSDKSVEYICESSLRSPRKSENFLTKVDCLM